MARSPELEAFVEERRRIWRKRYNLPEGSPTTGTRTRGAIVTGGLGSTPANSGYLQPQNGPGTEYELAAKEIADLLGLKVDCGACLAAKTELNRLGVEGCKRERERLLPVLRENLTKIGITWDAVALVKLAAWGIKRGLVMSAILHLGDLVGTLLDESIRQAESKQT